MRVGDVEFGALDKPFCSEFEAQLLVAYGQTIYEWADQPSPDESRNSPTVEVAHAPCGVGVISRKQFVPSFAGQQHGNFGFRFRGKDERRNRRSVGIRLINIC